MVMNTVFILHHSPGKILLILTEHLLTGTLLKLPATGVYLGGGFQTCRRIIEEDRSCDK
jgi:hypothetical protein